jgi:hypothetical protein
VKSKLQRRDFLIKCSRTGVTCCALLLNSKLSALNSFYKLQNNDPDPKELCYCGYKCTEDCQLLKGSKENNVELKKEAYELWKMKERHNIDFDPDKIFCFGCKTTNKPEGLILVNCTVRSCVMSKDIDCCIECTELADCEKELWIRFPKFKEQVIEMQKKYIESKEKM